MGAFDPKAGEQPPCHGEDILAQLNSVFGFTHMQRYKYAREHNKFGSVPTGPGNYQALIEAYEYAGLEVTPMWKAYLRALGSLRSPSLEQGPQNISDIAKFRDHGLKNNLAMSTITHTPHDGGHVYTRPGSGIDPEIVDSPFPLPA
jgi:hypothetical protein